MRWNPLRARTGCSGAGSFQTNVKLHDFFAGSRSGVGYCRSRGQDVGGFFIEAPNSAAMLSEIWN